MARDTKEPQSYGSEKDWVSGRTSQQPNDPAAPPPAEHADFYDNRIDPTTQPSHLGGQISPVQRDDEPRRVEGATTADSAATVPVTQQESGARRDSFFKDRDYPKS